VEYFRVNICDVEKSIKACRIDNVDVNILWLTQPLMLA